ncbi:MAG: hypothetical protein LC808_05570 [Actinobacteria bacterium]|nr:hypothetical protein [Actinomycetota bacterium]
MPDFGDAVAVLALVGSIVALYYSARSANASRASAAAAEQSVGLARKAEHRGEQPLFEWEIGPPEGDKCRVRGTMTSGHDMVHVLQVQYVAKIHYPFYDENRPHMGLSTKNFPGAPFLVKGASFTFNVSGVNDASAIDLSIVLVCASVADLSREWRFAEQVAWRQPA